MERIAKQSGRSQALNGDRWPTGSLHKYVHRSKTNIVWEEFLEIFFTLIKYQLETHCNALYLFEFE